MSSEVVNISAATFAAEVVELSHKLPVLVDFWAAWCAPCRSLAPVLEELAGELNGGLRVAKVDTDAEQQLAAEYGVRSLPTLLLFRDGAPVEQAVGVQSLQSLRALVERFLPRPADALLGEARGALESGDAAAAAALMEEALALDETDFRIHPLLAESYVGLDRFDDARAVLAHLPPNIEVSDAVQRIRARIELRDAGADADPNDAVAQAYAAALASLNAGDLDAAAAALLGLLAAHRDRRDGQVRKALLDLFRISEGDPRVKLWRREMARLLN